MAIDTILLAIGSNDIDHVDSLVDVGIDLATPAGASVELVHVFSESEYESLLEQDPDLDEEVGPSVVARSHESVGEATDRLASHDIQHTVRGAVGDDPADEVTGVATNVDADMVVIGGGSRSPTGKALFGDRAQQILLTAPCPVTFVRRGE